MGVLHAAMRRLRCAAGVVLLCVCRMSTAAAQAPTAQAPNAQAHTATQAAEFVTECGALVGLVASGEVSDRQVMMRASHTIEGNCSMFGVDSVAQVAHRLESALAESSAPSSQASAGELLSICSAFAARVRRLYGTEKEAVLAYEELESWKLPPRREPRTPR
jgi:HPt (histidine-containing phosphotransfer) domain-containing protein